MVSRAASVTSDYPSRPARRRGNAVTDALIADGVREAQNRRVEIVIR
jgi:hypothetical protein